MEQGLVVTLCRREGWENVPTLGSRSCDLFRSSSGKRGGRRLKIHADGIISVKGYTYDKIYSSLMSNGTRLVFENNYVGRVGICFGLVSQVQGKVLV